MTALFGFHKPGPHETTQALLQRMMEMNHANPYLHSSQFTENGFAAAYSQLKTLGENSQPVWNARGSTVVFMAGELFNRQELLKPIHLQQENPPINSDCALIVHLFEEMGPEFAAYLNGSFLILIWEKDANRITIINDRLGLHPLYYSQTAQGLVFATNLQSVLADPAVAREPDAIAIAEFLTFDHILGQRSIAKAIKLLPQASILTYENQQLRIRPYYRFNYRQHHLLQSDQEYIDNFDFYMRQAIRRQSQSSWPLALLLSGGLDSRYLLAILAEEKAADLHTFTWSIPGSDDSRYARECARLAGSSHHFFELKPDWLAEKAESAILLTSGNANLVNLHAYANLEEETNIAPIIMKGFMGDAMFGFGIRPRFWADYDDETLLQQHLEAYRDYRVFTFDPREHQNYFSEPFYHETHLAWFNEFKQGMLDSNCRQMTDQRSYFDLTQRVPRMTINGVDVVREQAVVRLPFADNDLVEFSLSIPPHLRYKRELMNRAFIEHFPSYAKIPIAQTRLPMMQCARELWQRNKQFMQWHLRNRGLEKLAGPVNRPYKDYNLWFRTVLKAWVADILLDPKTLSRGYLQPDAILKLIQAHNAGENHAVRLGALLSVELSHRLLLD